VSEDQQPAGVGRIAADGGGRISLLEQFMPRFDTRSRHAIEVHAPAQAVFTAVEAVTVKEVRVLRELEFIRALPGLVATGRLAVPALDAQLVLSFTRGAALLGARPPEEFLAGAIGCFWRLAGNEPIFFDSPEEFLTFTKPGFAKAVVGFRLDPRGAEVLVTTETRFVATDEATHRLMSRYWRLIQPASNLIRTEWLRAIRRRALRAPEATPEPRDTSGLTRTIPTSGKPTLRVLRR
jgi:hypothetical protein